ncbi:MAG: imidazole glycerol phosphate synthase subunit HisH [Bacteroidales bacterium]
MSDAPLIGIVDYGVGNLGSIVNMLKRLRLRAECVHDAAGLARADRLILPGVGAFDTAVQRLRSADLLAPLEEQLHQQRKPCLGICLGMQLLAKGSEEGSLPGLGWFDAEVRRFTLPPQYKIPHMGWSYVRAAKAHPLSASITQTSRFYFVHSYHMVCAQPEDRLMEAGYGEQWFTAAVVRGNVAGMQFHPEKSHSFGMAALSAFAAWTPEATTP